MVEYKESGYLKKPLTTPDEIGRVCGGLPPGTVVSRGAVPPGILIVRNFLEPAIRQRVLDYAAGEAGVAATVQDVSVDTTSPQPHESSSRVTDHVDIAGIEDWLLPLVHDAFVNTAGPHYGQQYEWFERPALLRYGPGGFYVPHADADNWGKDAQQWTRAMDRDVSILIYLDDDYQGGALNFPNFRFRMTPQAGMLVCFPSDHRFVHAAEEVTGGLRHVLVCWAAQRDGQRVAVQAPTGSVAIV